MKVLIENEAGSFIKHRYDECTFKLMATRRVQRAYPFPYGFIVGTRSGDGMSLDCFLLTQNAVPSGEMIEAEPIGMFEQIEDGKEDHNILAVHAGEQFDLDLAAKDQLRDFVMNVFADVPGKSMTVGRFLGKEEALGLIARCLT